MPFEVFERQNVRRSATPTVTLTRNHRVLRLNTPAVAALGHPATVELGFDFDLGLMRLRPGSDDDARLSLRGDVPATLFARWAGLSPEGARRWNAEAVDGALVVNVTEGLRVSSNRLRAVS